MNEEAKSRLSDVIEHIDDRITALLGDYPELSKKETELVEKWRNDLEEIKKLLLDMPCIKNKGLKKQVINSLKSFDYSTEQLKRINEIINE